MPDSRFYRRAGPFRLDDLARCCGGTVAPGGDGGLLLHDVANVDAAGPQDITYFADPRYILMLAAAGAGACVTTQEFAARMPAGCAVVIARDPRSAFADIAGRFYPDQPPAKVAGSGHVARDAEVDSEAVLSPGVVVDTGASIGPGTRIGANSVIGPGVIIGSDCRIGPNTTLAYCVIGDRVIIHPGVQMGQEGFGFVSTAKGHKKVPQLGRVIIHDDVEIGSGSTIDRGALGDTVIGAGTKIDNLVQIAHNVEIGQSCIIVSQVGISGSCRIGNGVVIGGQAGLADHVQVGDRAQIAAKSGVMRDVAAGEVIMGYPAKPIRQFWREIAALPRLTRRDKAP